MHRRETLIDDRRVMSRRAVEVVEGAAAKDFGADRLEVARADGDLSDGRRLLTLLISRPSIASRRGMPPLSGGLETIVADWTPASPASR